MEKDNVGRDIIIILLVLVAIVLVVVVVLKPEPQFTIYKDECVNESSCIFNEISHDYREQLFYFKEDIGIDLMKLYEKMPKYIINDSKGNKRFSMKFVDELCPFEEVCSQVEVDEIEIKSDTYKINHGYWDCADRCWETEINYSNNGGEEDWNKIMLCKDNCTEEYTYPEKLKISKQDLTLDWLSENCECLESDCGTICTYEVDDMEELSELKKEERCIKYKCREYFVEVK